MTVTASEISVELNGREVGLSALLTKVDQQSQKAADSALKLQAQYARLAQAQGNTAGATSILSNALANNGGASEQAIAGVATQLTKLQSGKTLFTEFGAAAKSSLIGIVGPAAAAAGAIQLASSAVQSFADAFKFKAELDATTASIKSQISGFRDANAAYAEALAFGRTYNITQRETAAILSSATDVLRTSTASVSDLEAALIRLQSKSPEKPISEASRALRELASGDTISIRELFQIPARDANKMKAEILAGGDAVKVLTAYLDRAQIGMQALEQRTQGAAGGMKELAVAQEDLALAQAKWAQGPGLIILQGQIRATSGLTRVLTGDFDAMTSSFAQTSNAGAQAIVDWLNAMAGVAPAQQAATAATQQHAAAQLVAADADDRRTTATIGATAALDQDAAQALIASVATEALAIKKQELAAQAQAAAQAVLAGGGDIQATAARLASSSSLIDQLTAAYIRLSQAQAAAGAAAALADQRAGERNPGASGAAEAAAQEERRLQQLYRTLANPPKAPRGGGGGGGGGRSRVSEAERERRQLEADEQRYEQKQENLEREHAQRRLDILKQYYEKAKQAAAAFAQSQLDSAASFYDSLGDIESNKIQQQASAEYEAAVQEAAQMGGEAGRRYLEEKEKVILARARRQAEIEQAEQEGDAAKAEYARGVDAKYRAAEDAKLQAIKDGGNQEAAERDRALAEEDARYTEASEKAATRAEQSGARRAQASAQAGQAVDAEAQKVDALAKAYERVGNRAGGPAAPAGPPAATSGATPAAAAPSVPSTATDVAPAGSAMLTALDSIRAAVDAAAEKISRAEGETTRAVKAGAQRGGVAG